MSATVAARPKGFINTIIYYLEIEPILTIRRIIWIIAGGWIVAGLFLLAALILCLTIIGIPMGLEAFRWALYFSFSRLLRCAQPLTPVNVKMGRFAAGFQAGGHTC